MKKLLIALGGVATSVMAFAEGSTTSSDAITYSGSEAESLVNGVSQTMTNFLSGAAPVITTVICAGLAIWIGIKLVGFLKSAFTKGGGR